MGFREPSMQGNVRVGQDRHSRLMIGCALGPGEAQTADDLWHDLLPAYRQRASLDTDQLPAYAAVLPSRRHRPRPKGRRHTNHLERLNTTFPQHCVRLVRQTHCFSMTLLKLSGDIRLFIHDYKHLILNATT